MILNIYITASYRVKWNGMQGKSFKVQNGVKQGGVLSPYLFVIFIDNLIKKVKDSKLGCYIGNKCAAIFVFADDVLLICPSRSSAQRLVNICFNYSIHVGMKFNFDKCKYMVFGNNDINLADLNMGGKILDIATEEKHVGHLLSSSGDLINFSELICKIAQKTNCIKRKFKCLTTECKATLFQSQCACLFGIELIDILSQQFKTLQIKWRKCARYLCDVHPRTHNELVPAIMGTQSVELQIYSRILCFMKKGIYHKSSYISFFYKNCMIGLHSYMSTNVNLILQYTNITMEDVKSRSEMFIKRKIKRMTKINWKSKLVYEHIRCRDGVMDCGLSRLQIGEMLNALCIE